MQTKNKVRLSAVAALVVAAITFSATSAMADPSGFKSINGVGSDTTQDVLNGLAGAISGVGSYNATDPATGLPGGNIQTTSGGSPFLRPNGSGNGVEALTDSILGTTWNGVNVSGQIDFARSSSGPSGSGDLAYIPFGRDAVTYAVHEASDWSRTIIVGDGTQAATANTLWNIYRCTKTTYSDSTGGTITIRPLLPQAGSGTRSFWLTTLGLTETTKGACVTDLGNTVQEHDGSVLTGVGDIVPFSVAQYIAQANHTATGVADRRAFAELGKINGVKPIVISSGVSVQNPSFPIVRNVYNVVDLDRVTSGDPKYDATLAGVFAGPTSSVCSNTAIIQLYGFSTTLTGGETCGSIAKTGAFRNP